MTIDNTELREAAVNAIAAYMKQELFEIGGSAMYPWLHDQAEAFIDIIDNTIFKTRKLAEMAEAANAGA